MCVREVSACTKIIVCILGHIRKYFCSFTVDKTSQMKLVSFLKREPVEFSFLLVSGCGTDVLGTYESRFCDLDLKSFACHQV